MAAVYLDFPENQFLCSLSAANFIFPSFPLMTLQIINVIMSFIILYEEFSLHLKREEAYLAINSIKLFLFWIWMTMTSDHLVFARTSWNLGYTFTAWTAWHTANFCRQARANKLNCTFQSSFSLQFKIFYSYSS